MQRKNTNGDTTRISSAEKLFKPDTDSEGGRQTKKEKNVYGLP